MRAPRRVPTWRSWGSTACLPERSGQTPSRRLTACAGTGGLRPRARPGRQSPSPAGHAHHPAAAGGWRPQPSRQCIVLGGDAEIPHQSADVFRQHAGRSGSVAYHGEQPLLDCHWRAADGEGDLNPSISTEHISLLLIVRALQNFQRPR